MFKKIFNIKISTTFIKNALGVLWLFDGLLQLQPKMFTSSFANRIVIPATINQPTIVGGPMRFAVHILLTHPAFFNFLFASTQICLGVFIIWGKSVKKALITSVFWALFVWFLGEGLGGIFTGNGALLMGAPGAALIYAVLALSILPSFTEDHKQTKPAFWLPLVWSGLWLLGSILVLEPALNSTSKLGSMIVSMGNGAPGYMARIDSSIGNFISNRNFWFIVIYAGVELLIALAILIPGIPRKMAVFIAIPILLIFWVVGQNLGSYYSGVMTDPNSAPLFVLLGLAILSAENLRPIELKNRLGKLFLKLEKSIT